MNKILLRIFLGLAAIIALLGFFIVIVVGSFNEIRKEHFYSELATAPLTYSVSKSIELKGLREFDLEGLVDSSDIFDDVIIDRLEHGQVVLLSDGNSYVAVKLASSGDVSLIRFDKVGFKLFDLYAELVRNVLSREDYNEAMSAELSLKLGIKFRKLDDGVILQDQEILESLFESGVYHEIGVAARVSRTYFRSADGEVYVIEYESTYSSFSWWLFFMLMFFSIGIVMLVAYYFVEGFSRRLRAIESAASRLSRGELEARVAKASDEDAISRLGLAFNSMADHIQRLMYVQKEMIHAVSHELLTPVARIRFGVQMIEDCPSPEAMSKQIRGIDGDIQELDELIDEILTYARLEQGGPILAIQEADVAAIVEQVISEQSSVKPDMEIFAEFKEGSDVWKISEVETRYIHRSIQNLVGNATRYAAGKVRVVCSFDSETCRIDVEDDGPGIPEDQWESVFTPFARLDDSRTRSSGGYGLGLSIVRRILYWHGGQAFLGRSDMGGAKFSLVWPRKQEKS